MLKKGLRHRKTRFPQKKNKRRCNVFCFKMEAMVHRNLRLEKSVKKVENSSFIQKIHIRFHHLQLYLWVWRLFDNYIYFFLLLTHTFRLFSCIGLFYFVQYLNRAVWPSIWCHFLDISSVEQFWGPLGATFSSWILSSGLNCARELRASSLKNQDCCSHHLANLVCGRQRCPTTWCTFFYPFD